MSRAEAGVAAPIAQVASRPDTMMGAAARRRWDLGDMAVVFPRRAAKGMAYPNRLVRDGAPRCSSEVLIGDSPVGDEQEALPVPDVLLSCAQLEAARRPSQPHANVRCKLGASWLLARS